MSTATRARTDLPAGGVRALMRVNKHLVHRMKSYSIASITLSLVFVSSMSAADDEELVVRIMAGGGDVIRDMTVDKAPGLHREEWNLREDPPPPSADEAPQGGRGGGRGFGRGGRGAQGPLVQPGMFRARREGDESGADPGRRFAGKQRRAGIAAVAAHDEHMAEVTLVDIP